MLRLLISLAAAVVAAAAAGSLLPGAAPFLADTPPAVLSALAAIATLLAIDLSTRSLTDGRTASQIRRLAAKSEALELEIAALRASQPASPAANDAPVRPARQSDRDTVPPDGPSNLGADQTAPQSEQSSRGTLAGRRNGIGPRSDPPRIAAHDGATPPPPRDPHFAEPRLSAPDEPTHRVQHDGTPIDPALLDSIREALRADRIALHVQPIVDMSDRQPRFYECFSRLRTAAGTLLTPQSYLPAVEAEGLTAAIDNMLLLRCMQLVRDAHRRERPVTFFCNISGHSLSDRVFFSDFLDFASDNALLSNHLVFEIEHRTLIDLPPDASRDLRALADLGYRFAIDNANLSAIDAALLTDHRVAFVKARVTDLAERANHDRHLIDLERPLLLSGADLIATHIERDSHLALVRNLPIPLGQGFLLGEPAPIETLRRD